MICCAEINLKFHVAETECENSLGYFGHPVQLRGRADCKQLDGARSRTAARYTSYCLENAKGRSFARKCAYFHR